MCTVILQKYSVVKQNIYIYAYIYIREWGGKKGG